MPKFTLISEHATGEKVTFEFEKEYLQDILQEFEMFLRGVGFHFSGNLEIVTELERQRTESTVRYQFDPNQKGLYDV